jgi:hypothetical protein
LVTVVSIAALMVLSACGPEGAEEPGTDGQDSILTEPASGEPDGELGSTKQEIFDSRCHDNVVWRQNSDTATYRHWSVVQNLELRVETQYQKCLNTESPRGPAARARYVTVSWDYPGLFAPDWLQEVVANCRTFKRDEDGKAIEIYHLPTMTVGGPLNPFDTHRSTTFAIPTREWRFYKTPAVWECHLKVRAALANDPRRRLWDHLE